MSGRQLALDEIDERSARLSRCGTYRYLPRLLAWLDEVNHQPVLPLLEGAA